MNVAYKHLDTKLRIADMTIGQWMGVGLGLAVAIGWGFYLQPPLGPTLTAVTAVYLGALPAGAALLASMSEFDLLLMVRSAIRWRRHEGRFIPGPGNPVSGYVLRDPEPEETAGKTRERAPELDPASLWEES